MAEYKDLWWAVRIELPGVPVPLLRAHYAEAVREFLSRSKAWQVSLPALDIAIGDAFPDMAPALPEDTYVVEPVSVKWSDGTKLTFKTRDQMDSIDSTWEQREAAGPAKHWTITAPGEFRLYPLSDQDQAGAVLVRAAIAPTSTAATVPDVLANEWQEAWAHGALARLFKIPGKDWTDTRLASAHGASFDDYITQAESRAAADYGRPNRQVAYGGLPMCGSGGSRSSRYGG